MILYHYPLVSGTKGRFLEEVGRHDRRFPESSDDGNPFAEVRLDIDFPGGWECGRGRDLIRFSTGGIFEIVRGGERGDDIELDARDVRFEPVEGRVFELSRMYWRVPLHFAVVPGSPPPSPVDAGVP